MCQTYGIGRRPVPTKHTCNKVRWNPRRIHPKKRRLRAVPPRASDWRVPGALAQEQAAAGSGARGLPSFLPSCRRCRGRVEPRAFCMPSGRSTSAPAAPPLPSLPPVLDPISPAVPEEDTLLERNPSWGKEGQAPQGPRSPKNQPESRRSSSPARCGGFKHPKEPVEPPKVESERDPWPARFAQPPRALVETGALSCASRQGTDGGTGPGAPG